MIRIGSEAQLLETFRSIDRDQVQIPAKFQFPLALKDYMSWVEPSGHRVYLVFEDIGTGHPLGVVFQRTSGADTKASMCQWCHTVRSGSGVGLLTATASRNHRVGVHVCSSLNCRDNIQAPPGVNDFSEGLSGQERLHRVLARMGEFAKKNLF
jgi:hypothetical protein